MELFQMMMSSVFTLIALGAVLFIAARAHAIGSDLGEIKDLLKEFRRGELGGRAENLEPGQWPSVADPDYDSKSDLPHGLRSGGPRR